MPKDKFSNCGNVIVTLEEYRVKHNISKNKLAVNTNVQRTQLQKYLNNDVSRVDLGVLARICDYLECDVSDILKYIPAEQDEN